MFPFLVSSSLLSPHEINWLTYVAAKLSVFFIVYFSNQSPFGTQVSQRKDIYLYRYILYHHKISLKRWKLNLYQFKSTYEELYSWKNLNS